MPTLRQLEYLVALADLRHFGRAAASLHVSQPTLSQQLKQLEQRLDAVLVERRRNAVELTPIGRDVVERARPVLTQVKELREIASRGADRMAGTLRFGVTPTLGPYLMPAVIVQLHRDFPRVRLHIREGIPDDQLAELRSGRIDLMLSPLPVVGDDLTIEPLFREPMHLVAPPDHPLARRETVAMSELAGLDFLSLDTRHHFYRQTRDICAELNANILRDYEGTSLDSLAQMVGSGMGVALLPELYLQSETGGKGMVKRIQVEGWNATRSIAAIWRSGSATESLYGTIADEIGKRAKAVLGVVPMKSRL